MARTTVLLPSVQNYSCVFTGVQSTPSSVTCSISVCRTLLIHHLKSDLILHQSINLPMVWFGPGDGDSIIGWTVHLSKGDGHWELPRSNEEHHLDDLNVWHHLHTSFHDVQWWVTCSWHRSLFYRRASLCRSGLEGSTSMLEYCITTRVPWHSGTGADLARTSQEGPKEATAIRQRYFYQIPKSSIIIRSRRDFAEGLGMRAHRMYPDVHAYSSPLAVFQSSQNHSYVWRYVTGVLLCENGKKKENKRGKEASQG